MTYEQAIAEFQEAYKDLYIKRVDYCHGQLAWATYIDNLNRDGLITDHQRNTWATPFKGKHLRPKKW